MRLAYFPLLILCIACGSGSDSSYSVYPHIPIKVEGDDRGCDTNEDCAIAFEGDVRTCEKPVGISSNRMDAFEVRRAELAQSSDATAATCEEEKAQFVPRCIFNTCVGSEKPDFTCTDTEISKASAPLLISQWAHSAQHDQFVNHEYVPEWYMPKAHGSEAIVAFQAEEGEGSYRFLLSGNAGSARWIHIREPDCHGNNLAWKYCYPENEQCYIDKYFGDWRSAVVVVRNCDDCKLSVISRSE